nr:promethin-like [Odocoileus virginianus texanus]
MAKAEPPSTSKDSQELQRKLSLLRASVQSNSKVVSFMRSPAGQDWHPFLTLTLLASVAVSAVPVGFLLLLLVLTSLAASAGVSLPEGYCHNTAPAVTVRWP